MGRSSSRVLPDNEDQCRRRRARLALDWSVGAGVSRPLTACAEDAALVPVTRIAPVDTGRRSVVVDLDPGAIESHVSQSPWTLGHGGGVQGGVPDRVRVDQTKARSAGTEVSGGGRSYPVSLRQCVIRSMVSLSFVVQIVIRVVV